MKALLAYLLLLALGLIIASAMLKPLADNMHAKAKLAEPYAILITRDYNSKM